MVKAVYTAPNGEKIELSGETEEEVMQQAEAIGMAQEGAAEDPGKDFTALETAGDVAGGVMSGAVRGGLAIPGMVGSLEEMGRGAINWAGNKAGVEGNLVSPEGVTPTGADYEQMAEDATGVELYDPKTSMGRAADKFVSYLPAAAIPGGAASIAGRLGVAAASGAGAVAGDAIGGSTGEMVGALAGGLAGARAISPINYGKTTKAALKGQPKHVPGTKPLVDASDEYAASVGRLKAKGFKLSAGDELNNPSLRLAESGIDEIPGNFAAGKYARDRSKVITTSTLKKAGLFEFAHKRRSHGAVGSEFFKDARNHFDKAYTKIDNLELPEGVKIGGEGGGALAMREALDLAMDSGAQAPKHIEEVITNIARELDSGLLTVEMARKRASRLGKYARANNNDSGRAVGALRTRILDAIGEAVPAYGKAVKKVNKEYRNFLVIRDAAQKAGSKDYKLTAQGLHQSAKKFLGREMEMPAKESLAEHIKDMGAVIQDAPNSGTALRSMMQKGISLAPAEAGVAAGVMGGGVVPGLVAAGGTMGAANVVSAASRNANNMLMAGAPVGKGLAARTALTANNAQNQALEDEQNYQNRLKNLPHIGNPLVGR